MDPIDKALWLIERDLDGRLDLQGIADACPTLVLIGLNENQIAVTAAPTPMLAASTPSPCGPTWRMSRA